MSEWELLNQPNSESRTPTNLSRMRERNAILATPHNPDWFGGEYFHVALFCVLKLGTKRSLEDREAIH